MRPTKAGGMGSLGREGGLGVGYEWRCLEVRRPVLPLSCTHEAAC